MFKTANQNLQSNLIFDSILITWWFARLMKDFYSLRLHLVVAMAEVEDAEADVALEAEEAAASGGPEMIAVVVETVAAAAGRGPGTPGLETGSATSRSAVTQTSLGETNAINVRLQSQKVPEFLQVRSLM